MTKTLFGSVLSFQETLHLTQLALVVAVCTKGLLSIFKEPMILEEARHPPVDDIHKHWGASTCILGAHYAHYAHFK